HMSTNKQAISALRLQKLLGFGSYSTAARWLRELRRVMAASEASQKLSGAVEVDEAPMGGVEEGRKGPWAGKLLLLYAVERKGRNCGRARIRLVPARDKANLCGFVEDVVQKGSVVCTDGYHIYDQIASNGFVHDPRVTTNGKGGHNNQLKMEDGRKKSAIHLGCVYRVSNLVDRVFLSAFQGRYSEQHIQGCLDEYCFRFNRRLAATPFTIIQALTERIVRSKPVPYWKSCGRLAPDKPGRRANREWERFSGVLQGAAYVG
ncbi:MAG TPA: IS1595 family transposase, partial [Fimbriimonas sp.]